MLRLCHPGVSSSPQAHPHPDVRQVGATNNVNVYRHRIAPLSLSLCFCFLLSYAQSIVGVELSAINRKFINICQQKTFKLAKQQNYL